jgi:methenyltetrahydrofolate cyclohydrolase
MSEEASDQTLAAFLDAVASRSPSPSAGAAAAVTVGTAAALAAMAARFAEAEQQEVAGRADRLRAEVLHLAEEDAAAYAEVLDAFRLPKERPDRRDRIGTALQSATDVPLAIADAASQVATMAAGLATRGNRNLVGEAQAAAALAEGAARATAAIVRLNVETGGLDHALAERADQHVRTAQDARTTATGRPD